MLDRLNTFICKIREDVKDETFDLEERILLFFCLVLAVLGFATICFAVIMLIYSFPRVMLPLVITITVLWIAFNRFLDGRL